MCWTLCVKKNLTKSPLLIEEEDSFKVWVIFNFLSEDKYPLIIVPEEVRCGSGPSSHLIDRTWKCLCYVTVDMKYWTRLFGSEAERLESKKSPKLK